MSIIRKMTEKKLTAPVVYIPAPSGDRCARLRIVVVFEVAPQENTVGTSWLWPMYLAPQGRLGCFGVSDGLLRQV